MSTASDEVAPVDGPPIGVGQAYLLLLVVAILALFVGSVVQFMSMPGGLAITELVLILLPAIVFVRLKGLPIVGALQLHPISWPTALASVLMGITSCGAALGMVLLLARYIGEGPDIPYFHAKSPRDLVFLFVIGAVLPGVCEEILFRGVIQNILLRRGATKAVLVTSLLFALFHLNPWNFIPPLFLGVLLGIMAIRTQSTVSSIIMHASANATAFTTVFLYEDNREKMIGLITILSCGFLGALAYFFHVTRDTPPRPSPLSNVPARLSRLVAWTLATVAGGCFALLVVAVLASRSLITVCEVPSDAMQPRFKRGDHVIVVKQHWIEGKIHGGDIVALDRGKRPEFFRVKRVEGEKIWIANGEKEELVDRKQLIGKATSKLNM